MDFAIDSNLLRRDRGRDPTHDVFVRPIEPVRDTEDRREHGYVASIAIREGAEQRMSPFRMRSAMVSSDTGDNPSLSVRKAEFSS